MTDTKSCEQYVCVHVRQFPAQAMLRLRPHLHDTPCVIMQGDPPLQFVCACNRNAQRLGIKYGMTRVEVETFTGITILPRSHVEESSTRTALLDCASQYTPRIEDCSRDDALICVLDITGTEKLFGAPSTLSRALQHQLHQLGLSTSMAISNNFHTAICVASARAARQGIASIQRGEEAQALSPLPLSVLDLTDAHAETLALWGIRTLDMLAKLPETALVVRLGQEGKRLRQLAEGTLPHLFIPIRDEFTLEEHIELDTPVELLDSLLFVLSIMFDQLILRATTHILALASIDITLELEGDILHARTVRPALPSNDRQLWLKLIHLDLAAHPPSAAILSVALRAESGHISKVQLGLFSPQVPEPGRLDVTLARISAIVGEDRVGRAVLLDTHHPDSFRIEPFRIPSAKAETIQPTSPRPAMRQLRPPERISLTLHHNRPNSFFFRETRYTVEQAYGPWRISGDWWNPTLWSQEQWDLVAHSEDREQLCCSIAYVPMNSIWQMVAFYD